MTLEEKQVLLTKMYEDLTELYHIENSEREALLIQGIQRKILKLSARMRRNVVLGQPEYRQITPADFSMGLLAFTGELPAQCIEDCTASGQVVESVCYWRQKLQFDVPREFALRYLGETGAWSTEELASMTPEILSERVLWIVCCDLKEVR